MNVAFPSLLPHSKLEATGKCGRLGPGPSWLSSTPMGPAWMASSLTHAEVTVTPTSLGQLGPMHSWSWEPKADLALKTSLMNIW